MKEHSNDSLSSNLAMPIQKPGLVLQEIGDELLIFDPTTAQSFCCNPVLGEVFQSCDGSADPTHVADKLGVKYHTQGYACLAHSLRELVEADLIAQNNLVSRREWLEIALKGAAIPALLAVSLPAPAAAQSSLTPCTECTSGTQFSGNGSCQAGLPGSAGCQCPVFPAIDPTGLSRCTRFLQRGAGADCTSDPLAFPGSGPAFCTNPATSGTPFSPHCNDARQLVAVGGNYSCFCCP